MSDRNSAEHSSEEIILNGANLTLTQVYDVMHRRSGKVSVDSKALGRVAIAQKFILDAVANNKVIYGVTTGFGSMCDRCISADDAAKLQVNLIRSHAIGTGNPVPPEIVRTMLLLRINCIAKGNSGVSVDNLETLLNALNQDVLPEVFEQGSVGASGDLCPLSHLMLGLMGEGRILHPKTKQFEDASAVLKEFSIRPLCLGAKEGLALNNGTQFITSYLAWAYDVAVKAHEASLVAGALTLEMLHGTGKAYDARISNVRPHPGQVETAERFRDLLTQPDGTTSEIATKYASSRVQEAYSLRCGPQIHGPVLDLLAQVEKVLEVEINSANDNPLLFPEDGVVLSGGNFHGQYPAIAADLLALAMATLANLSERRLERLVNGEINLHKKTDGTRGKHLPSFLVDDAGLNSGVMILQYQAAAFSCGEPSSGESCIRSYDSYM